MADSRSESVLEHLHRWLGSTATPADEGQLLERFVHHHDEEAFAELVARHGPLVFGLCRRLLGNVQDAEDVFQAAFLVLARKAATIRKPPSLSCWLHGVASRLAIKARTEAERRRLHEQQVQLPRQTEDADLSWREVRGLIDEELQRLPEKQRLPLVLCYLEGLTQDEAARRLGWPRGTLKRRLEAGRERLRLRLTQRGVTLGAGLFVAALTASAAKGAVPVVLRSATVRASIQFVTNEAGALAATPAALLAKGALQTMLTTKLKIGALVLLLLGCAVTAAGLAIPQAPPKKQPKNMAEAPVSARPARDEHVRKDHYGDPLPPEAIARLGTLRLRHQHMTASAVFTRDGETAIVGDSGGFIVYWDVATGQKIRQLKHAFGGEVIYALAITSDGKTLASGAGNHLSLWDVATGKLLSQTEVTKDRVWQLLFTPDGRTLAIRVQSNTVLLWDVAGKKKLHELKGHTGVLECMALSPDGKTLASGSWQDPHIRLWDIATGREKLSFVAEDKEVLSLTYSPDGKTIAAIGNRGGFAFFDSNTGKRLHKVEDYYGRVKAITYAPDGKTLFGIDRRRVHVLDAASGKHLRSFDAPPRTMVALTISPNGKTIATFWGGAHTFDLWDSASGKLLHPAPGHRYDITSLAFSADRRQIFSAAGIFDFPVQVWDARTGERFYELGNHPNSASRLALSPDGKLLAACGYNDNTIRLWDPVGRKEARVFKGHTAPIDAVAWSADGKTLASAGRQDKSLRIWDTATVKQRWTAAIDLDWSIAVALSPDGKSVAIGGFPNGVIRLWSAETGKELRKITTPQQTVSTLAFSPDGSALASGGLSRVIHLWEPATGRLLRHWDTKTNWINHLAFARDGRTLVSGHNDGSVHLWEVVTGKERACFQGHRAAVRAVAISRDGRRVASGGEDTTILVWDATAGMRPDAALSAEQLRSLWEDLNASDAGRAYRALWRMALAPERALPLLAERVRPIMPLDAARQKHVNHLLADLDNDSFAVREKAESELAKMGPPVESALRTVLEAKGASSNFFVGRICNPSSFRTDCKSVLRSYSWTTPKPAPEARRRGEAMLEKSAATGSAERLRTLRVLEAIEHMNTSEARRLVEALADGAPPAWLTEEAQAIRKRLAKPSGKSSHR